MSESRLKARRLVQSLRTMYARQQELEAELSGLLQTLHAIATREGGKFVVTDAELKAVEKGARLRVAYTSKSEEDSNAFYEFIVVPADAPAPTADPEVIEIPTGASA